MMIAYNKAHGLLLRTGYNTLSYYVVGSWDMEGTVWKSSGIWVLV